MTENQDRVLVARAIAENLSGLEVTTSPFARELGAVLLQARPGEVQLRFSIGERFTQATGAVQGGVVAAMLDFALAFAALSTRGDGASATTLTMTLSFLRPALPGSFEATGRLVRDGRRVAFAEALLHAGDGSLVATASSPLLAL